MICGFPPSLPQTTGMRLALSQSLILLMDLTVNPTQLFTVPLVLESSGRKRRVNSHYYADFKESCICAWLSTFCLVTSSPDKVEGFVVVVVFSLTLTLAGEV